MDERVAAYVQHLFAREDSVLQAIRARHTHEGLPDIAISPEEAQLIAVLLHAVGARRVLEVGTLGGYSGVWIARALPREGKLYTIEHDPEHVRVARESFAAAGVEDRVDVLMGDAGDVMARVEPPMDAVFLDADKPPLGEYYRAAMRLLRVGGLLLVDNALLGHRVVDPADGGDDVVGVRAVNTLAATDPRVVATIVPVRDGLLIGVKVAD